MDLAAMRAQIAGLEEQLQSFHEGYDRLREQLRALRVSVTSADGLVTATVDARGQVERIDLAARIYQRPDSRLLAATITATIQQAVAEVMERVVELNRPFVPEEVLRAHLDMDLPAALRHGDELWGGQH